MIHSLRVLLHRWFNQAFWLLLLTGLSAWGAWRICILLAPVPSAAPLAAPINQELQLLHLQSLASLDSSIYVLRLAVMTNQPVATLVELNEQIRQQTQEITLLSSAGLSGTRVSTTALQPALLDQCLTFRRLLDQKVSDQHLSQHLALFQSQVRYLHYCATKASSN